MAKVPDGVARLRNGVMYMIFIFLAEFVELETGGGYQALAETRAEHRANQVGRYIE